jgi:DNA polymerase III sliding clamp (beta) subunit (PCNA family)
VESLDFCRRLKTFPTDKFTELPIVQGIADNPVFGGGVFGLSGLKEQIGLVDFAVAPKEKRHVISSVLIESTVTAMYLAGTDGSMIAVATTPSDLGEFSFVVPKAALELVKKLDGVSANTITISETEDVFFFQTDRELVSYNKTHSEFPNFRKMMPVERDPARERFVINGNTLTTALQRVAPADAAVGDSLECEGKAASR